MCGFNFLVLVGTIDVAFQVVYSAMNVWLGLTSTKENVRMDRMLLWIDGFAGSSSGIWSGLAKPGYGATRRELFGYSCLFLLIVIFTSLAVDNSWVKASTVPI